MVWKFSKQTVLYGFAMAMLLFLLRWLELRFVIYQHAFEIYAGAIAIVFTGIGIWLALKLTKPKVETIVVEKEVRIPENTFAFNQKEFDATGLSKRELEVLQLMAKGLSNQEIADALFVSLNTIKTHSSRVFEKLDVGSRMQAVKTAREKGLIG